MVARAGFHALALSAALVMVSGVMLSDDAMAQAYDATVKADEAAVETEAAAQAEDVTVQAEEVKQPIPKSKPANVERPVKSDLDQSAVRAANVEPAPRPTRTSTRGIAVPKILGSYR